MSGILSPPHGRLIRSPYPGPRARRTRRPGGSPTRSDGDEGKDEKVVSEIVIEKGKDKLEVQFDPEGKFIAEERVKG
jgi:hypothetical protein